MPRMQSMVAGVVLLAVVAVIAGCGGGSSHAPMPQAVTPPQHVVPSDVVYPADAYFLGDLDEDGLASVGDAIKILRIVVSLDDPDPRADANQNGSTDVGDAIRVLRCVVRLDAWPIATSVDDTGGTVIVADGDVELDFPAGALAEDTVIEVEATTSYPADPDIVPGAVYEFGPPGTTFAQPVQVTIAYAAANIPGGVQEENLRLGKVEGGVWEAVAGSTVDTTAKTVTGATDSFSIYGVGAKAGEAAAIRQLYEDFAAACNAGDINALSNLISDSYLNDGELKNDFVDDMEESFNEQPDLQISFTIQQIEVQDSHATVHVTFEVTFAEGTETFTEPAPPGEENPLGVAWLLKEGDSWLVYGDQEWYSIGAFSVYHPQTGSGPYYAEFFVCDPADRLSSGSVSGPGLAGTLPLSPELHWEEVKWWGNVAFGSAPPPAPNEYSFTLVDADGTTTWTATIQDYFTQSAVNMRPNNETVSAANLVFTWDECPEAVEYGFQLHRGDDWPGQEVCQQYDSVPNIPYAGPPLEPGNYIWLACMDNANGNQSLTRGEFTVAP